MFGELFVCKNKSAGKGYRGPKTGLVMIFLMSSAPSGNCHRCTLLTQMLV